MEQGFDALHEEKRRRCGRVEQNRKPSCDPFTAFSQELGKCRVAEQDATFVIDYIQRVTNLGMATEMRLDRRAKRAFVRIHPHPPALWRKAY